MRHLPISASRFLGNTTAKYRWFAIFYLVVIFIGLPALAIGISHVSLALLIVIFLLGLLIFVFVLTVNYMHRNERYNKMLPKLLQMIGVAYPCGCVRWSHWIVFLEN